MKLWRALADRILPDSVFENFGRVWWTVGDPRPGVTTIAGCISVSVPTSWVKPHGILDPWRPWPDLDELMLRALWRNMGYERAASR
jgi:hypothetical protein